MGTQGGSTGEASVSADEGSGRDDSGPGAETSGTSSPTVGGVAVTRRRALAAGAIGLGGAALGGSQLLASSDQTPPTQALDEGLVADLAARYAPDLYFGVGERWFPTDPRPFISEEDGDRVVDGFDALDTYTAQFREQGEPPAPTVFYHGRQYADAPLAVVQFWMYSVFDQFSVNFHWHDWELLQVFVDLDADEPVLFVASAHSRTVPNNEHLDPERTRASIISEVGSHSSALGINETPAVFERVVVDGIADITNSALDLVDLPAAYGLPRDEGFRLPYVLPELEGTVIHEHPDLPNVRREDLVPSEMTVRAYEQLEAPPTELPSRETGLEFAYEGRADADAADHTYVLEPMSAVSDIDSYAGPQLSFEFAVPGFVEDALASHITTAGVPRTQERFEQPDLDITDGEHRRSLAERYGLPVTKSAGDIVARVATATSTDEALGSNGIETTLPGVEAVALLESDPRAFPTWNGVVAATDVPSGEHQLTINGAGVAPYSEPVGHDPDSDADDEPVTVAGAGPEGRVVVPPNRDAVKLRADASDGEAPTLSSIGIEDDFGGPIYEAPPDGDGRVSVYVHREGAYTAEVVDEAGEPGAYRVNPAAEQETATIDSVRTGKASLAGFLDTLLSETLAQTDAVVSGAGIDEAAPPDDTAERGSSSSAPDSGSTETETETTTRTTTDGDGTGRGDDDDDDQTTGTDDDDQTTRTDNETGGESGLVRALQAAVEGARQANAAAAEGRAETADKRLRGLQQRLDAIVDAIERDRDSLPDKLPALVETRIDQARRRTEQALSANA